MSKNKFTYDEMEFLKNNRYVEKVTESSIFFTHEFKRKCLCEHIEGKSPKDIFNEAGLDFNLLGQQRVSSNMERFKKQSSREDSFNRKKGSGRPKNRIFETIEDENRYLKEQNEYLKQEVEFLKKLEQLDIKHQKSQRKKNSK